MTVSSLLGPDANQFVFQNRGDLFQNSAWEALIAKFFRRGLMLLDFDERRVHRRIMQGAFSREALIGYLQVLTPGITAGRSEEHTSELQSLMRISYAVFCLKKKKEITYKNSETTTKTCSES